MGKRVITPTKADLGFEAFGVVGSTIGEDGDWVLLGHVEPRKAIAAWWRMNRDSLGLGKDDLLGYSGASDPDRTTWAELLGMVEHRWAIFEGHDDACTCGCDGSWWCSWGDVDKTTQFANAVTMIHAA